MSRAYVKKICLFGGTGFVGSSIIKLLAKKGHELKIATRSPFDEDVLELKSTVSDPGQIKIEKIYDTVVEWTDEVEEAQRGDACFGSSGK